MRRVAANTMTMTECPPLLPEAYLPPSLGEDACPWLDEYTDFSRLWSPRSYEGYHIGCALYILSVVAARRVVCHFGKPRYTNLSIALAGRTSINAKSSAAGIAMDTISEVGLRHLLLPDTCTPQSMIEIMSTIPENFGELTNAKKRDWEEKIPFLGQKGWFHEEFGGLLAAMMKKDGVMAEFKSILRRLDDCEEKIDYSTVARGYRRIEKPYLALLGLLPPSELQPYARKGASLWHDGFLARIMFIVAPTDYMRNGRFPTGERVIPASLLDPLRAWHDRLGTPTWKVSGRGVEYEPLEPQKIKLSEAVENAYYDYDEALRNIIFHAPCHDLDGNYARFPEKALRIAMLFASRNNAAEIKMNHWARAQQIAEDLRTDLHSLYAQVQEAGSFENTSLPKKTDEEKVLGVIDRKNGPTKRVIEQLTDLHSTEVSAVLTTLISHGVVEERPDGKTSRFVRCIKVQKPPELDFLM